MRILVLLAHGLPPTLLGPYGNEWVVTPAFDRLAATGVVFDRHLAVTPDSSGWQHAWTTGRYQFPDAAPIDSPNLPRRLIDAGVRTWHLTAATDDWLEQFAAMADAWSTAKAGLLVAETHMVLPPWPQPDDDTAEYLAELQPDEDSDEPLSAWLDPPLGPLPSEPPEEAFCRVLATCAAAVTRLDELVQVVCDSLPDDVLLLVTSGYGQALGEHGIVGPYRPWLHEEAVHLPLLIRLPGEAEAGRRVAALTQTIDVMPTLLDALGVPILEEVHGRSLLPLTRGGPPIRSYAVSAWRVGDAVEWALRTPQEALLVPVVPHPDDPPRQPRLYRKPDDLFEVNDLRQKELERAEALEATLRAFAAATAVPGPLIAPQLPTTDTEADDADGETG